jgi:hypothetical protein
LDRFDKLRTGLGDTPIRLRRTGKGALPLCTPVLQHPAAPYGEGATLALPMFP